MNVPPSMPESLSQSKATLATLLNRCIGAYSDITLRGYGSDLSKFQRWSLRNGFSWLPAEPHSVAAFINEEAPSKSVATIRRRVCAIQFAHRMADLPSPVGHSEVRLALRRAGRAKRRRPVQALGLSSEMLCQIILACPESLEGLRDAALFSVGYDTLCRSSELVAMRVDNLSADLSSIHVPRSKADPFGDGRVAYLSPSSMERIRAWLNAADLTSGPLFRGLHRLRVSDVALDTSSIRRRIKRAATRAELSPDVVKRLSGHSMRVGAAQDMMVAGFDALGIMQAGGWRTYSVLGRYVENACAARIHERRWERIA